uniref:Uncharacterized protein n=1 Tax=viral metagenome TaxID=1070528 RepID=A0A6M3MBD7_9ZZZZ
MTANIDPKNAILYPEILPEAITTTASSSGASIASYGAFSPYMIAMNNLFTNQSNNILIRLDNDSGHGAIESETGARPNLMPYEQLDVLCENSLDLWAIGSGTSYAAFTLKISKLTILEKIKYGLALTDEENELSNQFEVYKQFVAGRLKLIESYQFKKIIEIAKVISPSAGSVTTVGKHINVKKGEKAILLSIGVKANSYAGPGASDTYIVVNRDITYTNYVKLDYMAMPGDGYQLPMYIPAIDRLEVTVENTTALTDFPIIFRYGIADLTILEKIRWGLKNQITTQDDTIAKEYDLYNAVIAGVM